MLYNVSSRDGAPGSPLRSARWRCDMYELLRQLPRILLPREYYEYLNHYRPGTITLLSLLLLPLFGLWALMAVMSCSLAAEAAGKHRLLSDLPLMLGICLGPVALALVIRLLLHLLWRPEEPESGPDARWFCPVCHRRNVPGNTTCAHCGEGCRPPGM